MVSDQKLWKNFINGDSSALSSIYFNHAESLIQYGKKFTSKYEIIEDALQEVFLSLANNKKNLATPDNVRFYLLYAFRNCLLREIKKSKRLELPGEIDEEAFFVNFNIEADLSRAQIDQQRNDLIQNLINLLSSRQREAIYLRFKVGLSHQHIATMMNVTEQVSRNLVSQSIKRMKKQIDLLHITIESFVLLFF